MEVIFRAIDGKEYRNQEECVRHEQAIMNYRMWDEFGRTDDFDGAKVIHIPTDYAAERFVADCKDCGIVEDGIEGEGVYMWDRKACEWSALDNDIIQAIQNFIG